MGGAILLSLCIICFESPLKLDQFLNQFVHVFTRMIKELESQLEYERLRREKLESQLDECRSEIQHLNHQLERASHGPMVSIRG